jgi:hypothetical protein
MGVDFRDADNDGAPDIIVTALTNETFPFFRNDGAGQFRDMTFASHLGPLSLKYSGWGVAFADFDNDGLKDVFTANSHVNDRIEMFEASTYKQVNTLFLNTDAGFKNAGAVFPGERVHRGSAAADLDADGKLDIAVSALGEPAELWRNTSDNASHWIVLRLRGRKSNRDGIGTRVRIGAQHNHMTTAVGYVSSVHAGVHFGLGMVARIAEIEIRWPSGTVQTLKDVAADQVLLVTEPD